MRAPRKFRTQLCSLTAFLLCILWAVSAAPQATPKYVNNQTASGDRPFGSFLSADIDQVQLNNGALDVRLGLYDLKARGLNLNRFWHYTNKIWMVQSVPNDPDPPIQLWSYIADTFQITYIQDQVTCNGQPYPHLTHFIYTDEAGTNHAFDAETYNSNPLPGCGLPRKFIGNSIDGTGMTINVTDLTNIVVTLKDGTQVTDPARGTHTFNRKDPNGNFTSQASDGEIDTIGRKARHVTGTLADGADYDDWIVKDSNGNDRTTRVERVRLPVSTNFGVGIIFEYTNTLRLTRKIDLPNGLAYQFTYDTGTTAGHYGDLLRIDLPSGGYIRYEHTTLSDAENSSRAVTKRAVSADGNPANEKVWTYSYQMQVPDIYHNTTTVTDPDGNQSLHIFLASTSRETEARYYQGNATGTALRTVRMDYADLNLADGLSSSRPTRVTTILDNGATTKVETDYDPAPDTNSIISFSRANVSERREFDYGATTPTRRTTFAYLHNANSNYANRNIVDKVATQTVYDSNNVQQAQMQYEYDLTSIASTAGPPAVVQHDYTNYPSSFTVRGNVSKIKRWRNTDGALLATTNSYDDLGNLVQTQDPLLHTTSFSYTDSWTNSLCAPSAGPAKAFVTTTTNALSQTTTAKYYSCNSLPGSTTDANTKTTSYTYEAAFDRPASETRPDTGSTTWTYNDSTRLVTKSVTIGGGVSPQITEFSYDGLGRFTQTRLTSDPQGTVYSDVTYDGSGRKSTLSNPYRSTSESTYGLTSFVYDGLGRTTMVVPPDGTLAADHSSCTNCVITGYSGNSTTVTDQTGKQRRSVTDGLGRLVEVDEPAAGAAAPGIGSATITGAEQNIPGNPSTPGSGSVVISGNERWVCDPSVPLPDCVHLYDSGGVDVTINGLLIEAGYDEFSSALSIANDLANQFNTNPSSPVTASVSGSNPTVTITFVARQNGAGTNYTLSTSTWTWDIDDFGVSSFSATPSGSTLTGGSDGSATTYDSGTVSITVNGFVASASYGQGSTTTSVATSLVQAFGAGNSPVNAVQSGATINLTAKQAGASTNYAMSTSSSGAFSPPSFSASLSGSSLTGGHDVTSPSINTPAVTLYAYDLLDNLLCVEQHGSISGTGCSAAPSSDATSPWRVRRFTYNSLSQLLTAKNPESGTISYSYNDDGVMVSKTDARGITTNYNPTASPIDALHRVTQKTYSNGDPAVSYSYDQTSYNGLTITNGKGRRTGMSDTSGQTAWSYDSMGRVLTERRKIDTLTPKNISYTYNLVGSIATIVYPSGRTITYVFSASGRPLSAGDVANNINYATSAAYAPSGALTSVINGSTGSFAGITTTNTYNKRWQPVTLSAASPTATVFSLSYNLNLGTADNGNVVSITNNRDSTRSQSFTYDELNRLASAQTPSSNLWGNSYVYDAWGNLLQKNVTKGTAETLNVTASGTNQITGYCYDAAGNMTKQGACGTATYTYNAENQMTTTAGVTYTYNGEGQRVKKSNGTLYWGDGPLAESDLSGNLLREFVFFGDKRVARRDVSTGAVHYYFADHLGTADVVTNSTGTIENESDYYPWGGERSLTQTLANQNYKFTGKERDSESNLDNFGARYDSSTLGRFMTPDWSASPEPVPYAKLHDPQTLNLYSYARNNPLSNTDPDGHFWQELWNKLRYGVWVDNAHLQGALQQEAQRRLADLIKRGVTINGKPSAQVLNGMSNTQIYDAYDRINAQLDAQRMVDEQRQAMGLPPAFGAAPGGQSTGRTQPNSLKEQLAMEQAQSDPTAGQQIQNIQMKDPRWPASDGWVKMRQNINGVEIHYVRNTITGAVADFKFVGP